MHIFMLCRYDMEDAMVLNKSSVDRGLCHGHIYQVSSATKGFTHTNSSTEL